MHPQGKFGDKTGDFLIVITHPGDHLNQAAPPCYWHAWMPLPIGSLVPFPTVCIKELQLAGISCMSTNGNPEKKCVMVGWELFTE